MLLADVRCLNHTEFSPGAAHAHAKALGRILRIRSTGPLGFSESKIVVGAHVEAFCVSACEPVFKK